MQQQAEASIQRIERNLLLSSLFMASVAYLLAGYQGAGSALLGSLLAGGNLMAIHRGVKRFLLGEKGNRRNLFLLAWGIKFLVITLVLAGLFYTLRPSVLYFLAGFSLFIPAIFWETMVTIKNSDEIGE